MMTRLQRIEIRNFKAFREFALDLQGRHLLVYGGNGSGKSSLYWALYTFLQSAHKTEAELTKYFDPDNPQHLLNFHEQHSASPKPGEIAVTLRDTETNTESVYRISQAAHDTHNDPGIKKGNMASDFITYRFFFGFSHFRNSEQFDLWPLFSKELLPFCASRNGTPGELEERWISLANSDPNPRRLRGTHGKYAYTLFDKKLAEYANELQAVLDAITSSAQEFYNGHFATVDMPLVMKLGITHKPSFSKRYSLVVSPVLQLGILVNGKEITRPQSYLNEAKMTQIALSIRFGASLYRLRESDLRLLVLDDLLVSLDMSNRMKVVEILLSEIFSDYQKIVLTHDLGFFREFRRTVATKHADWSFALLEGTPATNIESTCAKTDLQKAEEYLRGYSLDEAAYCLRKATEATIRRFIGRNSEVVPVKGFVTLTQDLRAARNKLYAGLPVDYYQDAIRNTPEAHRALLISATDADIDDNADLSPGEKAQLKASRNRLRCLLAGEHSERLRQIELIDKVLACTERVLNPAAHSGDPPLYEKEVRDALDLIKQLETDLSP